VQGRLGTALKSPDHVLTSSGGRVADELGKEFVAIGERVVLWGLQSGQ